MQVMVMAGVLEAGKLAMTSFCIVIGKEFQECKMVLHNCSCGFDWNNFFGHLWIFE